MSKYLHFYKGYSDSTLTAHCSHETVELAVECVKKNGGHIVKTQKITVES